MKGEVYAYDAPYEYYGTHTCSVPDTTGCTVSDTVCLKAITCPTSYCTAADEAALTFLGTIPDTIKLLSELPVTIDFAPILSDVSDIAFMTLTFYDGTEPSSISYPWTKSKTTLNIYGLTSGQDLPLTAFYATFHSEACIKEVTDTYTPSTLPDTMDRLLTVSIPFKV